MGWPAGLAATGRLSGDADVVEYRGMLTIVRDRVKDLMAKGMTLRQRRWEDP